MTSGGDNFSEPGGCKSGQAEMLMVTEEEGSANDTPKLIGLHIADFLSASAPTWSSLP